MQLIPRPVPGRVIVRAIRLQCDRERPILGGRTRVPTSILGAHVYPDLRRLDVRSPCRGPSLRRAGAIFDIYPVLCRVGDAVPLGGARLG